MEVRVRMGMRVEVRVEVRVGVGDWYVSEYSKGRVIVLLFRMCFCIECVLCCVEMVYESVERCLMLSYRWLLLSFSLSVYILLPIHQ